MTVVAEGPITHSITPAALSIGTNESKTWNGTVNANAAAVAGEGVTVPAKLKGDYIISYSRPQGSESGGTVLSTHECSGCSYHGPGVNGTHEIVKKTGTDSLALSVISIKLKVNGKPKVCAGDTIEYTATTYPSTGGTVTWSTGQTGQSTKFVATNDVTVIATLSIGGVSYTDSMQVKVTAMNTWETVAGFPGFKGWETALTKVEEIKKQTKLVLEAVPAKVTVKGPDVAFSYAQKNCCVDGVVIPNGEKKAGVSITGGIYGKVPMLAPPWTAQFNLQKQKYGFVFSVQCEYGLFLDVGAEGKGDLGYRANECIPEDCLTGGIGINFPVKLSVTAQGSVCLQSASSPSVQCSGTTQNGARCGRNTTNSCGYCSSSNNGAPLHTTQSWWCFSCPSFAITPAALSTNFFGKVTYNEKTCTDGLAASAGMGPVTFSTSINVLGYEFGWSYDIWGGGNIYP
jgi:hypothetical protein